MATINPVTSQRQLAPLITSAVFAVVAGVAVVLRIVSKRIKKIGIDTSDYLIFAALVLSPWNRTTSMEMLTIIRSALGHYKHATSSVRLPWYYDRSRSDIYEGIIIGGVGRHLPDVIEADGPGGVVVFLKVTSILDKPSPTTLMTSL